MLRFFGCLLVVLMSLSSWLCHGSDEVEEVVVITRIEDLEKLPKTICDDPTIKPLSGPDEEREQSKNEEELRKIWQEFHRLMAMELVATWADRLVGVSARSAGFALVANIILRSDSLKSPLKDAFDMAVNLYAVCKAFQLAFRPTHVELGRAVAQYNELADKMILKKAVLKNENFPTPSDWLIDLTSQFGIELREHPRKMVTLLLAVAAVCTDWQGKIGYRNWLGR